MEKKTTSAARRSRPQPHPQKPIEVAPKGASYSPGESLKKKPAPFAPALQEPKVNIQDEPFQIAKLSGGATVLKVDLAYAFSEHVLISGWAVGKIRLALMTDGRITPCEFISIPRPDVAAATGVAEDELGFAIVVKPVDGKIPPLVCEDGEGSYKFHLVADGKERLQQCALMLGPALKRVAAQVKSFSADWLELISVHEPLHGASDEAAGFIEASGVSSSTGTGAAVGWVTHKTDVIVWLQDDAGRIHLLDDAFRLFRADVYEAVGLPKSHETARSGFIAAVYDCTPGQTLSLYALTSRGVHLISSSKVGQLSDSPLDAAKWLFGIGTPMRLLAERFSKVDIPVLEPLLANKAKRDAEIDVEPLQLGSAPKSANISVIVPLYGRWDFVEHQLMEFSTDPWFKDNVQLIYVLDDPRLKEPLLGAVHNLHALYKVPFLVVPGEVNRGFSAANNLGARFATGEFLLFLNSDVFPIRNGWMQELIAPLQGKSGFGAAGARLLFGDGSLQHAGIEFRRREDLGVWVNHHPKMGLDPSLDPGDGVTERHAVTGACLALRRSDFEAVGGWDTGYLIGDFEDTDMCLKIRQLGLRIAYVPAATLTHLERQSFKLLGGSEHRQQVVIYNAARHQQRWFEVIESSVS